MRGELKKKKKTQIREFIWLLLSISQLMVLILVKPKFKASVSQMNTPHEMKEAKQRM